MTTPEIALPASSLVVLVGPAGAGKTTFAAANFIPTEVLSSDFCRALVSDDEGDQSASPQAFAVLRFIAARRLRRGRLTVIDATNVRRQDRAPLLHLAAQWKRPAIAIVFDLPLELCLERNRKRERFVDESAIRTQWEQMPRPPEALLVEGFEELQVFKAAGDSAVALVTRWG